MDQPQQKYRQIKAHIRSRIGSGQWPVHHRVPSEHQLAGQFGVSRMTARRAVDELRREGLLVRSQGLGTFVAARRPQSSMLEVRNIADEIHARGHSYSANVISVDSVDADEEVAIALGVVCGARVFHSIIVHYDDRVPIQWEERYVHPGRAPDYLEQDFSRDPPNVYLCRAAPLVEAEQAVAAILPDDEVAQALALNGEEACLEIIRRTSSREGPVSYARLIHPGSRVQLGAVLRFPGTASS